uniref:NADH-ubiquinone oxidoreductase chain 4 n=1 Tax=Paraspadella gotoi TaxID=34758 RepID=Q6E0V5_PARGO|nr:NADH dehydrogenase subunit 4 [Paraspadella gotoi]AAT12176.1 NADH dehydrogenase subunit 4 [Paraspadella gotoi]
MPNWCPKFTPFFVPNLYFLYFFSNLSSFSKIPTLYISISQLGIIMLLLCVWMFQFVFPLNNIKRGSIGHGCVFFLLWFLFFFFLQKNLMGFYIMFEFCLIPVFFLIFSLGYQPEKLNACSYLALYTIIGSLPLLYMLCMVEKSMYMYMYSFFSKGIFCFFILLVMMVKTPMYMLHIWLPKAHVEAPVAGSMVLAGILLKMGTYGLFIFFPTMYFSGITMFFYIILICGGAFSTLLCLRQIDMKNLVAYSSVVHMAMASCGLMSGMKLGFSGCLMLCISHGLCSPMLFGLVSVLYSNSHTRLLNFNKGFSSNGFLIFIIFSLIAVNMSVPPSLNFFSELFCISSIFSVFFFSFFFLGIVCFGSVVYNLYLYISITHGKEMMFFCGNYLKFMMILFMGSFWCWMFFISMFSMTI